MRFTPRCMAAERAVAAGTRDPARVTEAAAAVLADAGIEPEYLELVAADTLAPVTLVNRPALALLAARVGETRLIDNQLLLPAATGPEEHEPLVPGTGDGGAPHHP